MAEVMMLGVLVALIKIADYATVIPGLALFTLAGLIVVLAAMQTTFDPNDVWQRIDWTSDADRAPGIVGDPQGTQ
jgi:paraquat-inducible protein A